MDKLALVTLVYAGAKFAAYCLWCRRGLERFGRNWNLNRATFGLGAFRLLLGIVLGLIIGRLFAAPIIDGLQHTWPALAYVIVFVPIRWIEWSIMLAIITKSARGFISLEPGSMAWRIGGIAVSCAVDAVLFAGVSFFNIQPGRIFC